MAWGQILVLVHNLLGSLTLVADHSQLYIQLRCHVLVGDHIPTAEHTRTRLRDCIPEISQTQPREASQIEHTAHFHARSRDDYVIHLDILVTFCMKC